MNIMTTKTKCGKNMIKKFNDYINENKSITKIMYQEDDFSVLYDVFLDIDLSDIPIVNLRKQYIDFKSLIVSPPMFGDPLLAKSKHKRLNEGENRKTLDIEDVRESIIKNYDMEDWQFNIKMYTNDIKVALIVPHVADNEKMIVEDMMSMGYYETNRSIIEKNGMRFSLIRFDPKYPKDITSDVRKMKFIKHITPKYNLESIKEHGFVPCHKNELFNYPPRTHFLKENISDKNINYLGEQLCDYNSDIKNNGEYVILTLDVSKIPQNVKFIGDSSYKFGICTEDVIIFNCVINIEELKFK